MYMKRIVGVLFFLMVVVTAAQAELVTVSISYTYSEPTEAMNLYMDGNKVCSTNDQTGVFECLEVEIPYGVHMFTLTAVTDGVESAHGDPYTWVHSPPPPEKPAMTTIIITINGENIQLSPVQ